MARPVTISDEQILDAARIVFVRDGVHATTKEIARRAGISEGSIFRRFPTKEALFAAAVLSPPVPPWGRELDVLAGRGDPRENLIHIMQEMLGFAQEILPLIMVAWGSKPDPISSRMEGAEPAEIRDRRLLTGYLKREAAAGRLRPCNEEAVARMLFGACINYVMEQLTRKQSLPNHKKDTFAQELVDALWMGINPEGG